MNFSVLLRSLAIMVLLMGAVMAGSVALSLIIPEGESHQGQLDQLGWGLSFGLTLLLSGTFFVISQRLANKTRGKNQMRRREAIASVGVGWLVCGVIAAFPFLFCEPHVAFHVAIFEAISGLSTTGATIFADVESLPRSILMWRSSIQWIGGIGILAIFVVVLSGSGSGTNGRMMVGTESSLAGSDLASIRQTMRQMWVLYLTFTVTAIALLWLSGLTPFQAVNHGLTVVSTAGFGTENDSATSFGASTKFIMMVYMIMCGVTFPLYLTLIQLRGKVKWNRFEEVGWFLGSIVVASCMVLIYHAVTGSEDRSLDIVFDLVSVVTTTGYVSGDYDQWGNFGKAILVALMIMGGCAGSTSGGLKVGRLVLTARFVITELRAAFRPQELKKIRLAGRLLDSAGQGQLFLVIALFGFFLIGGTLVMSSLEPATSFLGSLSAVLSCLSNVGPAFAEFGPRENFAHLEAPGAFFLSGLMILGRLEYVAVLVLFSRRLWRKY